MQTRGGSDGPLTTMRLGSHERDQRGADQVPISAEVREQSNVFLGTLQRHTTYTRTCQDCLCIHVHGPSCDDLRG